ncbi:MAG: hypothetical protein KKG93_11000, partial [Bacteroidetes bacterium]|nr:hypothetical protein [Bacteroidota bacterium]
VFFSRFKKLIIPEDNIVEAKELLNVLQKNYPGRKLELIPLAGYKSLFQNLDIVEVRELKFKDKLKANYGRYHSIANTVFSIIILIILIVIAAKFLIPLLDRNPIRFGIQGDRYVAYNEYGKSIWESKILSEQDIGIFNNVEREKRIILSDLDNDGYNDILLLLSDEKNKILNRTLFCYNHDGNLKWKTVVPKHDSLYGNDYCPDDILIAMMSVINSNKGKEIIINYRICLMFPNFTMKISSKGKIISEFYNPGSIDKIVNYDIDNDGKDELFFSGINNDFDKSGTLMLFDSEYLSGCAPGYRFPQNCSKGLMKYYILFPKTGVGKFTTNGSSYARLVELTSERIVVIIREIDGYTDLKNKRHYQEYITLYTLDGSLNVLNVETSSEFDAKYQMLVNEGKLKPIENWKEFKAKLKNNVQWWDGDRFVNHPVMNKYYQKVISQKTAIN